ncbi:hypothetical protein ACSTHJ_00345, partial [Vibrio parahaemolyticus]
MPTDLEDFEKRPTPPRLGLVDGAKHKVIDWSDEPQSSEKQEATNSRDRAVEREAQKERERAQERERRVQEYKARQEAIRER